MHSTEFDTPLCGARSFSIFHSPFSITAHAKSKEGGLFPCLISRYTAPTKWQAISREAVAKLVEGINNGLTEQTLMGVTGSGKTFTMANIIEQTQRPTLVLAHNKTLAAQLCTELREFFPENAVEYFVSYYDYYQPEAYIASTDTYIEKDSAINDEIDRLRHSATSALSERRDVIIVSSVSCIYSLGDPIDYKSMVISIRPGMEMSREELIRRLIDIQYERNDIAFERNRFRVRGDTVEIWPVYSDEDVVRIEFFGDEVDRISRINPLTGVSLGELGHIADFPGEPLCHAQGKAGGSHQGFGGRTGTARKILRGKRQADRGTAHRAAHPLRH